MKKEIKTKFVFGRDIPLTSKGLLNKVNLSAAEKKIYNDYLEKKSQKKAAKGFDDLEKAFGSLD